MDQVEQHLRAYYEAEADRGLRPERGERRTQLCESFASRLDETDRRSVVDVGAGPASDAVPFVERSVRYVGVDLAVGNASSAQSSGRLVVPASLFDLPFPPGTFAAGWSMSTFQHVPAAQIARALDEFVRVLQPGAPVVIGLWAGRDEVINAERSSTGIELPRQFTLRRHDQITADFCRHLIVESTEVFPANASGWEYHVATAHTPTSHTGT